MPDVERILETVEFFERVDRAIDRLESYVRKEPEDVWLKSMHGQLKRVRNEYQSLSKEDRNQFNFGTIASRWFDGLDTSFEDELHEISRFLRHGPPSV